MEVAKAYTGLGAVGLQGSRAKGAVGLWVLQSFRAFGTLNPKPLNP